MRRQRARMNHVMWEAFAQIEVAEGRLVDSIVQALRRNVPGQSGGWRVIRSGGRNGKRSR